MRREQHRGAQRRFHLGGMPVRDQTIGGVRFRNAVEVSRFLEPLPRPANARNGIDNDACRIDQLRIHQRLKRQDSRGRVAACGRHPPGAPDGAPVELWYYIAERTEPLGRPMPLEMERAKGREKVCQTWEMTGA